MNINSAQANIQQSSQEMFKAIQNAQQTNQDMANKMIKLSIEQQVSGQKQMLVENMVDVYM
mgnify:CR=1 FL=1